jgi:hypothetical protein
MKGEKRENKKKGTMKERNHRQRRRGKKKERDEQKEIREIIPCFKQRIY